MLCRCAFSAECAYISSCLLAISCQACKPLPSDAWARRPRPQQLLGSQTATPSIALMHATLRTFCMQTKVLKAPSEMLGAQAVMLDVSAARTAWELGKTVLMQYFVRGGASSTPSTHLRVILPHMHADHFCAKPCWLSSQKQLPSDGSFR